MDNGGMHIYKTGQRVNGFINLFFYLLLSWTTGKKGTFLFLIYP